jgi:hypothetical protein
MITKIAKGSEVQGTIEGAHAQILKAEVIQVLDRRYTKDFKIRIIETQTGRMQGLTTDVYEEEITLLGVPEDVTLEGTDQDIGFLLGITSVRA